MRSPQSHVTVMGGPLTTEPGFSSPMRSRARGAGAAGSAGRLRARRPIVAPIVAARAARASPAERRAPPALNPPPPAADDPGGMPPALRIALLVVLCAVGLAATGPLPARDRAPARRS